MEVFDIKSDMPSALEAGKRLADIIRDAKQRQLKVIKILHGYGSSGEGGKINVLVRKSLSKRMNKGEIKAYIPGEAISMMMGFDEYITNYKELIKYDSDFIKGNDGITYVII